MSLTNTLTDIFTGIAGEMWSIFLDAVPYISSDSGLQDCCTYLSQMRR